MARPSIYTCNEHYFDSITTPNQAYVLGFIWADGHVSKRNGLNIVIKKEDISILNFIKNELNSNVPINFQSKSRLDYVRLSINRVQLFKALSKLGLAENKSRNNAPIPVISEDLLPHFLRGFFDGDGSVWFNDGCRANFSGGYNFLVWLKRKLRKLNIECNAKIKSRRKGNLNGCSLDITNRKNIRKLREVLYENAEFKLKRKFERFEKAEKLYQEQDTANWKLNGVGQQIKSLMDLGLGSTKISRELNLDFYYVKRILEEIRKGKHEGYFN